MRRAAALVALAACSSDDEATALLVPDSVDLRWDDRWDGEGDGLATLVPVDVVAYDAATGAPAADLPITLQVAPAETGQPVGVLAVADVLWRHGADRDAEESDAAWWDARRDAFFAPAAGAFGEAAEPRWVSTDAGGVARFYLLVDALPAELPVTATDGETEETFLLVPR